MSIRRIGKRVASLPIEELEDRGAAWHPSRAEQREQIVRVVEYSHYPRISRDERRKVGFTRDESRSGMCVAVNAPEEEGTLLRVALRNIDGGDALDALARVAWCDERPDGRYWVGLALLEQSGQRMLKVRRPADDAEVSLRA